MDKGGAKAERGYAGPTRGDNPWLKSAKEVGASSSDGFQT